MATALIIGATGLVGQSLTQLCLESTFFENVLVISRRPVKIKDKKLSVLILEDFENLSSLQLPKENSDIYSFCCLGTTMKKAGSRQAFKKVDHDFVIGFASLSSRYNAKHFSVISSLGASRYSFSYYLSIKGKMEYAIKEQKFHSTSVVRPGLLLGERAEHRLGENIAKRLAPLMFGPWKAIEAFDVAKAMLALSQKAVPGFFTYPSHELQILADGS